MSDNHKVTPPPKADMKSNMESLIHHFKLFPGGIHGASGLFREDRAYVPGERA
jgi:NADH-quinone oxidoreductase subunit D